MAWANDYEDALGAQFALQYGDGFCGRDYYLILNGQGQRLNEGNFPTNGSPADEQAAREKAITILQEKAPQFVEEAKIKKFTWNGCM